MRYSIIIVLLVSGLRAASAVYAYDSLSRITRVAYPDGTVVTYTYDAAGNRLSQIVSNLSVQMPKIGIDKSTLTFSAAIGQTSGSQAIAVTNAGGGSLQWDAVATANWLIVTPGSGTNSGAVNVTASAVGLSAGTYNANVMILASASNPSVTIPVIFTVTAAQGNPSISSGGIVSAAGASPGIARGSIASLYGNSLADGPSKATSTPLPRTLGNTQVVVNGVSAPLWYADSNQINFQVPFESPLQGQASVVVTRGGVSSSPMNVTLTPYAPSVFTYQRSSGIFDPIIVHSAGNQLVTPTNPAMSGEYLVVYGTGIGDLTVVPATDAPSPTSPPATAKVTPTATIGGVNAPVAFAGLTPGGIGLAQFNVRVPSGLPSGSLLPLLVQFGSVSSSPVNLAIRSTGPPTEYSIKTVAGNGVAGYSGDGGPAIAAEFKSPQAVALDISGNLFIADSANNRIRKVTTSGSIITIVGNGLTGFSGDGGPGTAAVLSGPESIAVDSAGNLFIADTRNHRVRKLAASGVITTVAGTGSPAYGGDGGPATAAALNIPEAVAVDSAGNLYIADNGNYRIRKVSIDGTITTVAGNGVCRFSGDNGPATSAGICSDYSLEVDPSGNLFIADWGNRRVRKVRSDGTITTVAGNGSFGSSGDGGPATSAGLYPCGIVVDPAGNLFVSDSNTIRKVAADGTITAVAGTGTAGYSGDGGPALKAELGGPSGMALDAAGNIYFGDVGNSVIRRLSPSSSGGTGN